LRPVPDWTVIQVYGLIKPADVRTFESYTENVNPDATLVILTSRGGYLAAGIDIGMRVHLKKLIVGVMGTCASSCALIWIGGETGRNSFTKMHLFASTKPRTSKGNPITPYLVGSSSRLQGTH
jgi:ATP-dependent protease ClpP protease subunit